MWYLQRQRAEQVSLNYQVTRELCGLQNEVLEIQEIPQRLCESVINCKDVYKDVLSVLQVSSLCAMLLVVTYEFCSLRKFPNGKYYSSPVNRLLLLMRNLLLQSYSLAQETSVFVFFQLWSLTFQWLQMVIDSPRLIILYSKSNATSFVRDCLAQSHPWFYMMHQFSSKRTAEVHHTTANIR